jgi:hypothetical protein
MTTAYTPNIQLGQPATGDRSWGTPLNVNAATLDGLAPIGGLCVTLTEVPSATLNVAVSAGSYLKQDGTVGTYAGTSSEAITLSSTKVLYLDLTASGALTVGASFPTTAHIRLATVATGVTTVSSITDARIACNTVGTILDGINLTVGSTTGTQIGTATTQKLGFFGHTPAVQPTMGAATASSSYTSTEQEMLQAVYNAVRALGLGS